VEWFDPLFVGGHWVPEMIPLAGGIDGMGHEGAPSTVIPWEQVVEFDPEVMVVMPCGYKIERTLSEVDRFSTRVGWYDLPAVRGGRVYIVDSPSYFSRPGPRTVNGLEILAEIIHPELFSGLVPPGAAVKLDWSQEIPIHAQRVSERFPPLS